MKECPVCRSCFADAVDVCDKDAQPLRPALPIDPLIANRYRLLRRVGSGSVSAVFFAIDEMAGTNHALKVIHPDFIVVDQKIAEEFLLAATAVSSLNHPNIVAITNSGLIDSVLPFLVMDFIQGVSLREMLKNGGALTPLRALEYLEAIGSGVASAHAKGMIHGDLKPRNILIEQNRPLSHAIKITDFGLSSIKTGKLRGRVIGKGSSVLRSPLYLAPEEWSEEESDNRSDIYSLGVILYQMVSGRVPFDGKSIPAIMKRHLMDQPPPIAGCSPLVTPDIERVIMWALEKDPAKRPRTADDFVEEFRDAVNSSSLNDVDSDNSLMETIVLGAVPTFEEEPEIDLNQTIVVAKPASGSTKTVTPKVDSFSEKPSQPDFEMTLVPGMMKNLAAAESNDVRPVIDVKPAASETEVISEEFADDLDFDSVNDDTPVPRSIPPVILAVGVVLFIALIAIGIYYSRTAQ